MKTLRLRMFEKVRTTDAAPTRDALLTIPTAAEWAAYSRSVAKVDLGKVWDGFEASMEALDDKQREALMGRFDAYREIKAGQKQKPNTKDSGASLDHLDPAFVQGTETCQSINASNTAFWDKRLNR
jgi:hypothetical protein